MQHDVASSRIQQRARADARSQSIAGTKCRHVTALGLFADVDGSFLGYTFTTRLQLDSMDDTADAAALAVRAAVVTENPEEAFRILTRVVRTSPNHVEALVELGKCYLHGHGTVVDVDRAYDVFKTAAELSGHPDASYYQARIMFARGDDDVAAIFALMPAVDVYFQGRPSKTAAAALFLWGKCKAEGRGMEKNATEGEFFVREALRVRVNFPECQAYLSVLIAKRLRLRQRERQRRLSGNGDNDDNACACVPCLR